MRRLLILSFLFCLLSLTESVNAAPSTITKTELDLKLELQKKDIDANKEQTAETKTFIKEELNNQKEYNIDSRKYISDKAEIINWWLAGIGLVVTLIGAFSAWRVVVTENDVKDKIKEIVKTAQKNDEKMMEYIENASKLNEKIKEYEVASSISCSNVKQQEKEVNDIVEKLPKSINHDISPEDPQKIEELVHCVNATKPESELTAKDWLLKGYAADQRKDFENACYYYKRASQLDENMLDLYNLWGISLSKLAEQNKDVKLYSEAISKYEKAIGLDPINSSFYNNWGYVLSNLAKLNGDTALYNAAISKYEKAIEIDSNYKQAYNNLGAALSDFAEQKSDAALYNAAISKCEKAVEIDSNYKHAYLNWGVALLNLAKLNGDAALYNAAISKYEKAIEIDSNFKQAYCNLGAALSDFAEQKSDAALYNAAISKYEKAIEIDSNYKEAYINWSVALMQLSVSQDSLVENKQRIEELLLKAESLTEGAGSYNLACLYSLLNEKDKALEWLEKNLNNKEYKKSRAFIEMDNDFDTIKEDPRFVALLN